MSVGEQFCQWSLLVLNICLNGLEDVMHIWRNNILHFLEVLWYNLHIA